MCCCVQSAKASTEAAWRLIAKLSWNPFEAAICHWLIENGKVMALVVSGLLNNKSVQNWSSAKSR